MGGAFGDIRQLGYVVQDLGRAVETWTTRLGVGPWTIIRDITLQSVYRGEPSAPLVDIALGYRGDLQIDLIAPNGTSTRLKSASSSDGADNVVATYSVNTSGSPRNGTWQLKVTDVYSGDTGYINQWSIQF